MWISSWLHDIPIVLINGSIPVWMFLVACHGTLPLALSGLTVLIIYHWIKIEDMLIKFADMKIGRVLSMFIDGFVIQHNPK